MESLSHEITKMEYDRLCTEIASLVTETNMLARYAVVAGAAVFTFTLTQPSHGAFFNLLKALPFLISAFFGFRVYAIYRRVELISNYIQNNIEATILKQEFPLLGWETHLNNNIRQAKFIPHSFSQVATILFWVFLLLLTGTFMLM